MATALRATAPGTAWVVATGCLTNVAALFLEHPDLAAHVAGVSAMGGAVGGGFTDAFLGPPLKIIDGDGVDTGEIDRIGNWTVWAEWNILADPEAARLVLGDIPGLKGKVTLVPLDLTHQVLATPDARKLLLWGPGWRDMSMKTDTGMGKTQLRTMVIELLMFFASTYESVPAPPILAVHADVSIYFSDRNVFNIPNPPLHDPLAILAVLAGTQHDIPFFDWDTRKRGVIPTERFAVSVVTEGTHEEAIRMQASGGPQTGRTVVEALPEGEPGVKIPRGLNLDQFWVVLEQCLERADEAIVHSGKFMSHLN
jgi:uridine nucleosidase